MVSDLNCTLCHLEVHGTVVSLGNASPVREDSNGKIFGRWLATGLYQTDNALRVPPRLGGIIVTDGVVASYDNAGKELPVDAVTGLPTFPVLDFTTLAAKMQGSLAAPASGSSVTAIDKVSTANTVLIGTAAQPIKITRDIFIQGDLVIKGVYSGVGTIYVSGNIYIPANLVAAAPVAFPYTDDPIAAKKAAAADLAAGGKDALGLATAKNIFIGDIENYTDLSSPASGGVAAGAHGARQESVYTIDLVAAPASLFNATVNGVWDIYAWYPELQYELLYESVTPCWTASARALAPGHAWGERAWNRIDAYIYAGKAIAGVSRASNWTLNGGMIAQSMHIVSGSDSALIGANAQCSPSRINFDYRLQNGLQVLEHLGAMFPAK